MVSNIDGNPQLVQRVSVKIPMQSIRNAGYDEGDFKIMVNEMLGLTSEVGLNVKPIKKETLKDSWGTSDKRGGAALTGEYFTFDAMEPVDPYGMTRMTFDQDVNDIHGGSKLQNENYNSSFIDSYQTILNMLQ